MSEKRKKQPMTGRKARPRRIGGKVQYMPEGGPPAPTTGEAGLALPVPHGAAASEPPVPPSEMVPLEAKPTQPTAERYVRMRVRVRGDKMEVVGAKVVEGPLVRPERLYAGLVYEAALSDVQIDFDSLPDVGVRRSFPPPGPEGEMIGHHIEELPSYEFAVRIPQQQLSEQALRNLRISVYRVKGAAPEATPSGVALLEDFPQKLHTMAELKGIRLDSLPEGVQEEVKKALER